jgi:hypothetical protein
VANEIVLGNPVTAREHRAAIERAAKIAEAWFSEHP